MIRLKLFFLFLGLLLLLGCRKKSPTETPPNNNIHPQVDILWPSLADSPWPIAHGNVQCTGRSPYKGPKNGTVEWIFTEDGMRIETGSPVIGEDGTIYFLDDHRLYAINPNGTLKWRFDPGRQLDSTPMIGIGDIIYFGAGRKKGSLGAIFALNNYGTVRWEYPVAAPIYLYSGTIGLDGTIYYIDMDGTMYAINPDGSLKWTTIGKGGLNGGYNTSISISHKGYLYVCSRQKLICIK